MNKTNERRTPVLTLYRGKRKDTEEWIESFNINSQTDIRGFRHIYLGLNVRSVSHPQQVTIEWVEVAIETVGRWIGMYDTYNHREKLFEGDVVEVETSRANGEPVIYEMTINTISDYVDMGSLDFANSVKLLGNIFDEPKYAKHINNQKETANDSPLSKEAK
ncbi:MAG: hypothetical protein IJ341_02155 [Bacteroidales bacterium]|nr:hypothetical protein [Bacteroidales bacterium]